MSDWTESATCGHVDTVAKAGPPEWRMCHEAVDPRSNPENPRCTEHLDDQDVVR